MEDKTTDRATNTVGNGAASIALVIIMFFLCLCLTTCCMVKSADAKPADTAKKIALSLARVEQRCESLPTNIPIEEQAYIEMEEYLKKKWRRDNFTSREMSFLLGLEAGRVYNSAKTRIEIMGE